VNTRTQAYLVLLLGGGLVRLGISDSLLRYVRPVARPWVLVSGIGLALLAVAELVRIHRQRSAEESGIRIGWMLIAPIVAIIVVAPPALGSFSASHASSSMVTADAVHKEFPPLTGAAPHRLQLFDFTTRVLWDEARTVVNTDVQLTGFVLSQRSDGFVLARLVITCCAADARPVEVFVRTLNRPPIDAWLTVTGRYAGTDPAEPTFPVVTASSIDTVKEPANPYD
jgi:uncharacterized repeat protein (TIGR03943 family)